MLTLYRFPTLYRLAMRVGYGADAEARYPLVADLVADPTDQPGHILELCCGDLAPYRHLLRRGLARSYLGLEQSSAMLRLAPHPGRARDRRLLIQGSFTLSWTVMLDGGSESRSAV